MSEGFRSLQRLGVEAAVAGLTTPAELLRTLSIDAEALSAVARRCAPPELVVCGQSR